MFFRARRSLHRALFDLRCRSLLRTPPLTTQAVADGQPLTLVSMVCHGEVLMYLLAVKSFCRQLGRVPSFVVLDDDSLTSADRATIAQHLPTVRFFSVAAIDTGACPKGSCWERLMLICSLSESSYVVQLDCDTLTSGPIAEVNASIESNESFTLLGDRSFPVIEPMLEAHVRLKDSTSTQVQAVCERGFDQLPEAADLFYLRGNAGFSGFARGSLSRAKIEFLSGCMRRIAGPQWDEWGSEQVTSNLAIANTPGARPLPAPRYVSFWAHPELDYRQSSFIHFIGPHRYDQGLYGQLAVATIAQLNSRV